MYCIISGKRFDMQILPLKRYFNITLCHCSADRPYIWQQYGRDNTITLQNILLHFIINPELLLSLLHPLYHSKNIIHKSHPDYSIACGKLHVVNYQTKRAEADFNII